MATLKIGSKFAKWEDVFSAVEKYSEATLQPFIRYSSKLCSSSNRKLKEGQPLYPEELKWVYWTFRCCHFGTYTARPNGKRKRTSQKVGCSARIHAALDKSRTHIQITTLDERHCHELSEASVSEMRKRSKSQALRDRSGLKLESKSPKVPKLSFGVSSPSCNLSQSSPPSSTPVVKTMQIIAKPEIASQSVTSLICSQKPSIESKANIQSLLESDHHTTSSSTSQTDIPLESISFLPKTDPENSTSGPSSSSSSSVPKPQNCVPHSCCNCHLMPFLSFVQKKDEEDRKLREREVELRHKEIVLRQKEIDFLKQRFEFDKLERKALLDLLKGQLQTLEHAQKVKKEPCDHQGYTIVVDSNVFDTSQNS